MRFRDWLLPLLVFCAAASRAPAALADEPASDSEYARRYAQLKFEPLVDGLCYVAEFKVNVPGISELIFKYNLTVAQVEALPDDKLAACRFPYRPRKLDINGQVTPSYELWLRTISVYLHPKNAMRRLDPDYIKIDPFWEKYERHFDRGSLYHNKYIAPDESRAQRERTVRAVTPGGATCAELANDFPDAQMWVNAQAGRDLVSPAVQDMIAGGSATSVQATIVVPSPSIPKFLKFNNTSHTSTWVGLTGLYPGNGDAYLAQAGVAQDLTQLNGTTTVVTSAFTQYYPNLKTTVPNFIVSPGDLLEVSVTISGTNGASAVFSDITAVEKATVNFPYSGTCGPVSPACNNGAWALFRTEQSMVNIATGKQVGPPAPTPNFGAWTFLDPLVTVNASPP